MDIIVCVRPIIYQKMKMYPAGWYKGFRTDRCIRFREMRSSDPALAFEIHNKS